MLTMYSIERTFWEENTHKEAKHDGRDAIDEEN